MFSSGGICTVHHFIYPVCYSQKEGNPQSKVLIFGKQQNEKGLSKLRKIRLIIDLTSFVDHLQLKTNEGEESLCNPCTFWYILIMFNTGHGKQKCSMMELQHSCFY